MLRWVNRMALVIGMSACGAALGQPAMPDPPAPVVERTVTIRLVDPDGEPVAGWPMGISTSYSAWRNQAWADTVDEQGRHPEVDLQFVPALSVSDEDGVIRASVEFFEGNWRFQIGFRPVSTKSEREQYPESTVERIRERNRQIGFAPSYSFQSSVDPALMIFEIRAESVVQVHATLADHREAEPPAPVVDRTVTIRLLDPEGEPVVGIPLEIETSFDLWRSVVGPGNEDSRGNMRSDAISCGPNTMTGSDGVARVSSRFFDGDWRFRVSYSPPTGPDANEQFPGFSLQRIESLTRVMDLPSNMRFELDPDPSRTRIEIRLEPRVMVWAALRDQPPVADGHLSACLMELPIPDMLMWLDDGAARARTKLKSNNRSMEQERAGSHEVQPTLTRKRFLAKPGADHLLWVQADGAFARCSIVPASRILDGGEIGEFKVDIPECTGILNVRGVSAFDPEFRADELSSPRRDDGMLRLVLVAADGSFFLVRELISDDDYRSRPTDPRTGDPVFKVVVPPGEYYIMDGHPADGMPTNPMRFRLLEALLRGNQPGPGEVPMITVVEGLNPYFEIDFDGCYHAIKAWYDKRFPTLEFPGFD